MSIAAPALESPAPAPGIPLWVKLLYTGYLCVLVPVYSLKYGPYNFLWFCDIAMTLTLIAMWTEKALPASMAAVGIVFPQIIWVVDFAIGVLSGGHCPLGMASYMFDSSTSLFARGLSTFHGWLPFLLIWMVRRLGYDRRALAWQTVTCWCVLIASYLLVASPDPTRHGNVNKLFGPSDNEVQDFMPRIAWLAVLMVVYPLVVYVPSHLVFRRLVREPDAAATV